MSTVINEKPVNWRGAPRSGAELYLWRRSTGLNRATFARLANFSERTLATCEKDAEMPVSARPLVTEAVRLVNALLEIIPAEDLPKWLQTPNAAFDGRKPWKLIQTG